MGQVITSTPYVFDRSEADHERLVRQAGILNDLTREACVRAGLQTGQSAIDVGCGPLGVLPVLADLVGSTGTVIGLDASAAALAQAREVLGHRGVHAVKLVEADINSLRPEIVAPAGPVDVAVARFLLMYQIDPVATLRRIAALVRPGGRIIAIDVLHDSHYPRFDPPILAAERIARLFFALVESKGGCAEIAMRYPAACEEAGLRMVSQRAWCTVAPDPRDYLALYRDILLSMHGTLLGQRLATADEINTLAQEMDAARSTVRFGSTTIQVEMIAELP